MTKQDPIKKLAQQSEPKTKAYIATIMITYLGLNIKSKAITNKMQQELVVEHILNNCGNLEPQEIEYIFREGIKGQFGPIFNDISIDTICGRDGWIETYYKEYRHRKPQHEQTSQPKENAISQKEFYKRNPDLKRQRKIKDLQERLKGKPTSTTKYDLKYYMKLINMSENDYYLCLHKIRHEHLESKEIQNALSLKEYGKHRFYELIMSK